MKKEISGHVTLVRRWDTETAQWSDNMPYGNGQNHVNFYTAIGYASSKATKLKGRVVKATLIIEDGS